MDQPVFGEESTAANSKLKVDTFIKPPIAKLTTETVAEKKETVEATSIFGNSMLSKPEKSLFGDFAAKQAIDEKKPENEEPEKV